MMRQVPRLGAGLKHAPTTSASSLAGEITRPTLTAQVIVVPKGVNRMSVVMVTPGSPGWCCDCACAGTTCHGPGVGGAVAWTNCLPVIPGETLTIGQNGAAIVLTRRQGNKIIMKVDQYPSPNTTVARAAYGGSSAQRSTGGYTRNTITACDNNIASGGAGTSGAGIALYGLGVASRISTGVASRPSCMPKALGYGAGGNRGGGAGEGGIRLIWGSGRAFPTNARKITP